MNSEQEKHSGILWYSKKQAEVRSRHTTPFVTGKLEDGTEVIYTEMMTDENEMRPSLWDDAVCLGRGYYAGK